MAVASVFDLDVVLGAFAAGIIVRQLVPAEKFTWLEEKLEVLAYGLFIPAFFVTSGMAIDTGVIADRPSFLGELWTTTGSSLSGWREKLQVGLYSATGLPIIVAVTGVATSSGILEQDEASLLVAGGALTVLVFPLLAGALGTGRRHVH